jgi:hypothetical protein
LRRCLKRPIAGAARAPLSSSTTNEQPGDRDWTPFRRQ